MRRCTGRSGVDPRKHRSGEARNSDKTGMVASSRQVQRGGHVQSSLRRHVMVHGEFASDDNSDRQGTVLDVGAVGKLAWENTDAGRIVFQCSKLLVKV